MSYTPNVTDAIVAQLERLKALGVCSASFHKPETWNEPLGAIASVTFGNEAMTAAPQDTPRDKPEARERRYPGGRLVANVPNGSDSK